MAGLSRKRLTKEQLPDVVIEKWNFQVLKEGFVPLPKRLLRSLPRVFTGTHAIEHLSVILAIVDYRRPNLKMGPSIEYLAFIAGMPVDKFRRRLNELQRKKLVAVKGTDEELEIEIRGILSKIDSEAND